MFNVDMLNLTQVIIMSDKKYWVEQYLRAKRNNDERARRRAYHELIKILGDSLKDKDIK